MKSKKIYTIKVSYATLDKLSHIIKQILCFKNLSYKKQLYEIKDIIDEFIETME